jgi:hypothetical protein
MTRGELRLRSRSREVMIGLNTIPRLRIAPFNNGTVMHRDGSGTMISAPEQVFRNRDTATTPYFYRENAEAGAGVTTRLPLSPE